MHLDERSETHWLLTNPGGMCTSSVFPTTNIPIPYPPEQTPVGQGVVAPGDGIVRLGSAGEYSPYVCDMVFFGQGSTGSTFMVQCFKWVSTNGNFLLGGGHQVNRAWIPILLGQYTVTLGSNQGPQTADIDNRFLFAGTITQTFGPTATGGLLLEDSAIHSPGNSAVAQLRLRVMGARFLEVAFQMGTATSANCLIGRG